MAGVESETAVRVGEPSFIDVYFSVENRSRQPQAPRCAQAAQPFAGARALHSKNSEAHASMNGLDAITGRSSWARLRNFCERPGKDDTAMRRRRAARSKSSCERLVPSAPGSREPELREFSSRSTYSLSKGSDWLKIESNLRQSSRARQRSRPTISTPRTRPAGVRAAARGAFLRTGSESL